MKLSQIVGSQADFGQLLKTSIFFHQNETRREEPELGF